MTVSDKVFINKWVKLCDVQFHEIKIHRGLNGIQTYREKLKEEYGISSVQCTVALDRPSGLIYNQQNLQHTYSKQEMYIINIKLDICVN